MQMFMIISSFKKQSLSDQYIQNITVMQLHRALVQKLDIPKHIPALLVMNPMIQIYLNSQGLHFQITALTKFTLIEL